MQEPFSSSTYDTTLEKTAVDSSSLDLSLQLSLLGIEDCQGEAVTSTPCKLSDVNTSCLSPDKKAINEELHPEASQSPVISGTGDDSQTTSCRKPGIKCNADVFYYLSPQTKIRCKCPKLTSHSEDDIKNKVTYDMIGGLHTQLKEIRETIELPLKQPELFKTYGKSRHDTVMLAIFSCLSKYINCRFTHNFHKTSITTI